MVKQKPALLPEEPEDITSRFDPKNRRPSTAVDDFVRSTGNLAFTNVMLKYMVLVCGLVILVLAGSVVYLAIRIGETKPLPIFINQQTGEAKPQNWSVVDAQGEQRIPAEIRHVVEDVVNSLYVYTKYTVKSNLDRAFQLAAPEALSQMRASIDLPTRGEYINRNAQGLCIIKSVAIQETSPSIRVQVYFTKKVIGAQDNIMIETNHIAVLQFKTVPRSQENPHGLVLVEYSENLIEEKETTHE